MQTRTFSGRPLLFILIGALFIGLQSFQDPDEEGIKTLVVSMHESFQELVDTKDNDHILQYFLPRFMTHSIMIDADNKGQVASFTHENYEEYLDGIGMLEGVDLSFENVRFLDIEVKDGIYFNVVYKCLLSANTEDEFFFENTIIVTITGKKVKKDWKIANYSVVSFDVSD